MGSRRSSFMFFRVGCRGLYALMSERNPPDSATRRPAVTDAAESTNARERPTDRIPPAGVPETPSQATSA
jgi:hypothetical protein